MQLMSSPRCRECGKVIEWIDVAGSKVAIEPKPTTYVHSFDRNIWIRSSASVAHFDVCPMAEKVLERKRFEAAVIGVDPAEPGADKTLRSEPLLPDGRKPWWNED
jgi:hypothetical protein